MKNKTNIVLFKLSIVFFVAIFVATAGCVRYFSGGDKGTQVVSSESSLTETLSTPGNDPSRSSPEVALPAETSTPIGHIKVEEVDPNPYITPDPYRLPYRSHGNWTTGEPIRVSRIPQFTKNIVLRSNSTAFQLNVTEGPLVIDLTYKPVFSDPDRTSMGNVNSGDDENSEVVTNSFVYSNAEVSVIDEISGKTVAKDGYNGVYSIDTDKKITIYSEGSYVIAISGNFIDVDMAIITGSAPVGTTVPTSGSSDW